MTNMKKYQEYSLSIRTRPDYARTSIVTAVMINLFLGIVSMNCISIPVPVYPKKNILPNIAIL